jgi:hypothetical protein
MLCSPNGVSNALMNLGHGFMVEARSWVASAQMKVDFNGPDCTVLHPRPISFLESGHRLGFSWHQPSMVIRTASGFTPIARAICTLACAMTVPKSFWAGAAGAVTGRNFSFEGSMPSADSDVCLTG